MGLLVGSTARDMRTAPAIANLLFFPMMFLSGSAMPFAVLPDGVKRFARLLPTTYLIDTYSSVIVRGEGLWRSPDRWPCCSPSASSASS